MKINSLASILMLITGSVITIGGISMNTDEIIANAQSAVNGANLHQLATVLEVYYSDQGSYPDVNGGVALIDTLKEGNYIMNQPLNPSEFIYEVKNSGQDYSLSVIDE